MEDLFRALFLFLITAIISANGSLQLGPVNGGVLRYCLRRNFRAAMLLGLGGSLTELPYAAIALFGSDWLQSFDGLENWIRWGLVPIFFLLGLKFLFSARPKTEIPDQTNPLPERNPLYEGMLLALFNPQLPLFWISILLWYKSSLALYPQSIAQDLAFIAGTASGAFFLMWILVRIARKNQDRLLALSSRYNPEKLIGWFFILLALAQLIRQFFA